MTPAEYQSIVTQTIRDDLSEEENTMKAYYGLRNAINELQYWQDIYSDVCHELVADSVGEIAWDHMKHEIGNLWQHATELLIICDLDLSEYAYGEGDIIILDPQRDFYDTLNESFRTFVAKGEIELLWKLFEFIYQITTNWSLELDCIWQLNAEDLKENYPEAFKPKRKVGDKIVFNCGHMIKGYGISDKVKRMLGVIKEVQAPGVYIVDTGIYDNDGCLVFEKSVVDPVVYLVDEETLLKILELTDVVDWKDFIEVFDDINCIEESSINKLDELKKSSLLMPVLRDEDDPRLREANN